MTTTLTEDSLGFESFKTETRYVVEAVLDPEWIDDDADDDEVFYAVCFLKQIWKLGTFKAFGGETLTYAPELVSETTLEVAVGISYLDTSSLDSIYDDETGEPVDDFDFSAVKFLM